MNFLFKKYIADPEHLNLKYELQHGRFSKRFEDNMGNRKETWRCIDEVLHNGKKCKSSTEIINNR